MGGADNGDSEEDWGHGEDALDTDEEKLIRGDPDSDEENPDMDEAETEETGVHEKYVNGVLVRAKGKEVAEEKTYEHLTAKSRREQALNRQMERVNRMVSMRHAHRVTRWQR